MAEKQVFLFEVDGVENAITDFSTLNEVVDMTATNFNNLDTEATDAAGALDNVGDSAKKVGDGVEKAGKESAKGLEGLNVELINSNARMESLRNITDGVATTFAGATAGFISFAGESPRLSKLNERVGALAQTLGGVVALTQALGKENRKALTSLIGNFSKAGKAAKAFSLTTRGAIAATGIGLLVIALAAIIVNFDKISAAVKRNGEAFKQYLNFVIPGISLVIDKAQDFAKTVGGFRQAFAGALSAAQTFFSSIGKAFANLLRGDIGAVREVFANLGKDSAEAFNEGIKESNERIAQERADALLASEIKINERLIAERKAAGQNTFQLEKANLSRQIKLAEEGSDEQLDLISERNALINANNKAASDARLAAQEEENKLSLEAQKKADEEALAEKQRLEEEAAELDARNKEASFERSQLLREAELAALEAETEKSLLILEESANLRLELAQNERDKSLENEQLTNEERLLILEEFQFAEAELERQRLEEIQAFEDGKVEAKKKAEDEKAAIDTEAKEKEKERDEALAAAKIAIEDAQLANARGAVQLIGQLAEEGSQLQKAAFAIDKALAVAEIIINLQRELSAIAATTTLTLGPLAPPVIAAQSIQAGIRAALGVATVASTFIKAEDGGLLRGPSHAAGGIKGKGSFGNIEAEGGEFIVNKRSTKKHLPLLRKINRMKFQDGGIVPNFGAINEALAPAGDFNEVLIEEIRAINAAPVVVSVEEINTVNERVADIKESATI